MTKPFILILSISIAVLAVLSTLPAFAEQSQLLAYVVCALAVVTGVLAICLKGSGVVTQPAPAITQPEPEVKAPETHTPDIAAIPEQSGEVQVAQLLSLLQEKGRFLDFVMDDIKSVPDAQIAAAARFVHQGCQSVMQSNFKIEPIADVAENQSITLAEDYERGAYRLTGKIDGEPPHAGTLKHKGWKTSAISLPKVMGERANASGTHVLAAAEVEV